MTTAKAVATTLVVFGVLAWWGFAMRYRPVALAFAGTVFTAIFVFMVLALRGEREDQP